MVKKALMNAKIFLTNQTNKKDDRVGLVGSGKIAFEYARVIRSFNHKIHVIVSKNKSNLKKTLVRKYKIQNEINDFKIAIQNFLK